MSAAAARSTGRAARSPLPGPLAALVGDDDISEIMVNGPGRVWVDRRGSLEGTDLFVDAVTLEHLVEQLVGPLGRRVDRTSPLVEARLGDGSRVHVVARPLAVDGPYVTIRRFRPLLVRLEDMAPDDVCELLRQAIRARSNLVVSGGTSSGKTTLLNALSREISPSERVITIEDAAELQLEARHVVRLETRPRSLDGPESVSMRELVRAALRMRPDRVIVGEVRGPEALDMLQAMNTGHDGSLSTCHANSAADALRRLEVMVMTGDSGLPLDAVRALVGSAVDLVVQLARDGGGERRVVEVGEPTRDGVSIVRLGDSNGLSRCPTREPRSRVGEPLWR